MNDENGFDPIDILLSREELLLVLDLLQVRSIPGLDVDPLGELNEEQRKLALVWAGRALRARGLAQLDEDELAVHNALLTAVGICAYSNNAIFIYHWPEDGGTPTRYFGHIRGNDIAVHTRPEDVLHLFSLLPSKEELLSQVLDFCEIDTVPETQVLEMHVSKSDFVQARELANNDQEQQAIDWLTDNGAVAETAVAFITTLTHSPRVSILQTLKQDGETAVQKSDFTVVQNNDHAWLVIPSDDEDELLVKTTTEAEIQALIIERL